MTVRKRPVVVERGQKYKKRSPPGNLKAKQFRHELILDKVAALYLEGKTQHEIGQQFNPPVTQKTVSQWVREIQARWVKQSTMNFDLKKAEELAKIDNLEREAILAWKRSQRDESTKRVIQRALRKAEEEGDEKTLVIVGRIDERLRKGVAGNPSFLAQIERCIEMRCRIFGFTRPADVTLNQTNNNLTVAAPNWDDLLKSPEQPNVIEEKLAPVRAMLPVHVETVKEKGK